MDRRTATANSFFLFLRPEAWEPLRRYQKVIDVARDNYPFRQQIKIFVCFLLGQFELNEQSEKAMPTMLTCSRAFSLLLLVFGGFPWGSDGPNRTQNERVNPCALPWSSPILSLCPGKRRRQCAAYRVFLISFRERRKKNRPRPRTSWVFCGKASTVHGSREYLTVSQRASVAVGLAGMKERTSRRWRKEQGRLDPYKGLGAGLMRAPFRTISFRWNCGGVGASKREHYSNILNIRSGFCFCL